MGAPLKPVFNTPGKRGRKHADDLRTVVDAMLYIAQTGLPVALPARVGRLELVLVDRGLTAGAAARLGRRHGVEVRRVGWDDKQPDFRPIRDAWRVEVAHGRLGRCRRLAKSFENTTTSATGWL